MTRPGPSTVGVPVTINAIDNPDVSCPCVTDHRPSAVQLHRHHILPLAWGGDDDPTNVILLCPSTHANVHRLLREHDRHGGTPPWTIRRWFGGFVRDLARSGWVAWRTTQEPTV